MTSKSHDYLENILKLTNQIRRSMRAVGVDKRSYVLRAYAETQLIIAESKGRISHPYLQFVAGHTGYIEARYSTNKGMLKHQSMTSLGIWLL
jgi:hypothetical protein